MADARGGKLPVDLNKNLSLHLPFNVDRRFTAPQPIPIGEIQLDYLADENGNTNMAVNGAVNNRSFRMYVPPGRTRLLMRMVFMARGKDMDKLVGFGRTSPLANGTVVRVVDGTTGQPNIGNTTAFTSLARWTLMAGARNMMIGPNKNVATWEWPIYDLRYSPVMRNPADYIEVLVRDDLTHLDEFYCLVTCRCMPD